MYNLFYDPECQDDDRYIGEDEYECRHPMMRGTGDLFNVVGGSGAAAGSAAVAGASWAAAGATFGISAAIGAVTLLIAKFKQRAQQKVATTQIVNEAEPLLQQNLQAWQQSSKTVSDQAQALANFDVIWAEVSRQCNQPQFGKPGTWCTDDRKAGACKWRDANGECWNWFVGYRDPIASDTNVVADPSFAEQFLPQSLLNLGSNQAASLLIGAGLLIGVALLGGMGRE